MDQPTAPAAPLPRPDTRFLLSRLSHLIALGFGSGLSPRAPGTVGTLWAWAAYLVIDRLAHPSALAWGLLILISLMLGWWASLATARRTGIADPGFVVIDEIVAFWLILWLTMPLSLWGQAVAFALFRYFDAAKPGPVGWADRAFKGGGWRGAWGIMFDDLVAAFCTLLVMAAWQRWHG